MEFSALPAFTFEIQSIHFLFSPLCIGVLSNDDKIACQKILEKMGLENYQVTHGNATMIILLLTFSCRFIYHWNLI